ncbi:MAG: aminotransferase [Proteobacteria bacterium]|nr:aminotransferase [Pseudomonadota bacterium]
MRKNFPYDTEDLWNKDRRYVLHPWQPLETGREEGAMIIAEAEGIYVYDSDGNKFIDGPGGMWCVQIGYGRDEIADAVADQIRTMPYYSPFTYFGTPPAANLAAKLAELTPGDLNNIFLSTAGSEANDTAIRFVQFFNNMLDRPEKKHVITRDDAYHGSTYLAASLCGKEGDKYKMDVITDWVHHISSPNPYRRPDGQSVEDFRDARVKELEDKILEVGPHKVAAFIAEPVMASGGMMVPPPGYHKMTLEVCRKYDVIYISDEVVTGFGRLGHFFASEAVFDIVPDIITCAKGLTSGYLPLAATIISDRLLDQVSGKNAEDVFFANGFTYSGHPVCCVAALKNIEIMEREKICEYVREVGPYFHAKLEELRDLPVVGDVRGSHLLGCVEAVMNKETRESFPAETKVGKRIDVHCQERGLILRPFGSLCMFSPPLIITRAQIDTMVGIMRDSIVATMADLKSEGLWDG